MTPHLLGQSAHPQIKRWNYDYTGGSSFGSLTKLADKRVAFVGTGATAIQAVPYLAESAKELYVVQRTPSAVEWRENKATDEKWWKEYSKTPGWQYERDRNFTLLTSNFPVDVDLVNDAWTSLPKEQMSMLDARERFGLGKEYSPEDLMQMADFRRMNKIRDLVGELVKDKATAEALKPWYNRWCKRPTFSDTYLQSFNRPSVKLLDTQGKGLDRVTEKGIVVNGKEYEVDCIIWGTGFEIGTSWKQRNGFELIGRDGMTLQKKWRAGMKSLFGIATRALPNFYMYQNAQAGASFNLPWIYYRQAEWTVEVIKRTLDKGAAYFEVTDEAEKDWQKTIVEKSLLRKEFLTECTPGYYNFEGGRTRVFDPLDSVN